MHHKGGLARELVDDVGQPGRSTVGGLVALEVDRPHLTRSLRAQKPAWPAFSPALQRLSARRGTRSRSSRQTRWTRLG